MTTATSITTTILRVISDRRNEIDMTEGELERASGISLERVRNGKMNMNEFWHVAETLGLGATELAERLELAALSGVATKD